MNIRRRKRIKNDHHDLDLRKVRIGPDPGLVVVLVQDPPKRRAKRINVIGPGMRMNTERTKRKVKRTR